MLTFLKPLFLLNHFLLSSCPFWGDLCHKGSNRREVKLSMLILLGNFSPWFKNKNSKCKLEVTAVRNQTKTEILILSDKALVVSGVLLMLVQTGLLGVKWTVLHLCSKNIHIVGNGGVHVVLVYSWEIRNFRWIIHFFSFYSIFGK